MNKHTHPEIIDPALRRIMANELWTLRRSMRKVGTPMSDHWVQGIRLGIETALRRVNYAQATGAL